MSFGFPNTVLPFIPGLSGVVGAATKGVNEGAKAGITELATKARSELFSNPMVGAITGVSDTVTSLQGKLTQIASGAVANPLISVGDATSFLSGTGLSDLNTSLSNLTLHTNRLSGVLQGVGITVPGLEQIATVGKMMNNMANLIDGSQGCLNVIGATTGLFSQDQVNGIAGSISSVVTRVDNNLVTISEITDIVVAKKNEITAIISKDTNFLGQCVAQLKNAAFGFALNTAMSDPCAKFILERVGTPSFLTKLQTPPIPSIGGR